MSGSNEGPVVWHRETITDAMEGVIRILRGRGVTETGYLAGGTGLALQLGHRRSIDLDFFFAELFDEDALLARLKAASGFSLVAKAPHTVHAVIGDIRVSFLGYPYPVLFPPASFSEVAIADPRDIACMKISAVASRGTKRDFIDLHAASQRFGLPELLVLFARKYVDVRYNRLHILKSLTFFEDAEKDPMPHMLGSLAWNDVKSFFEAEVRRLA